MQDNIYQRLGTIFPILDRVIKIIKYIINNNKTKSWNVVLVNLSVACNIVFLSIQYLQQHLKTKQWLCIWKILWKVYRRQFNIIYWHFIILFSVFSKMKTLTFYQFCTHKHHLNNIKCITTVQVIYKMYRYINKCILHIFLMIK